MGESTPMPAASTPAVTNDLRTRLETQALAQRIVRGLSAAPAHGSAAITFGIYPFLRKLFADGGYQGQAFRKALAKALPHFEIEIVKRPDHAKGFEVLPRRWFAERAFPALRSLLH